MALDLRFDADLPGIDAASATADLADLAEYPSWLGLVLAAQRERRGRPADAAPAWTVELGARLGPLRRSKHLRMALVGDPGTGCFAFAREEGDGREHGRWRLDVEVAPVAGADPGCRAALRLRYDGGSGLLVLVEPLLRAEAAKAPGRLRTHLAERGSPSRV